MADDRKREGEGLTAPPNDEEIRGRAPEEDEFEEDDDAEDEDGDAEDETPL